MKPKYEIGEKIRIISTGEIKEIKARIQSIIGIYMYGFSEAGIFYEEYKLAPYRPSRTGVRGKDGRFVFKGALTVDDLKSAIKTISKQRMEENYVQWACPTCKKDAFHCNCSVTVNTPTPEKIEMKDAYCGNCEEEPCFCHDKVLARISALEERVKELEKNKEFVPSLTTTTTTPPNSTVNRCTKCGKQLWWNTYHTCDL